MMLEQGVLERDLVELEISDRGREGIDMGTEVILLGFPKRQDDGMCLSMMKGMVDSIGKQICFQVPNYGGNSGGPSGLIYSKSLSAQTNEKRRISSPIPSPELSGLPSPMPRHAVI